MYVHTEEFRRRLADPDTYTTRVYSLLSPTDPPIEITDYFVDGQLTVGRQEIRTSGTVTFLNETGAMLPINNPDHPLGPYGQELLVYRGVTYDLAGDTYEELIPYSPMRITAPEVIGATVTVRCYDRAWRVKRAKLEAPLTIANGTPCTEAAALLIRTAWPEVEFQIVPTSDRTPTIVLDAFSDPWVEALKILASCGYVCYFDRLGVCRMHPELDYTDVPPVWSYDDASLEFIPRKPDHWANLGLPTIGINWDTEDTFNVWVVRGENSENAAPYVGIYRHTDPTSPLRYGGRFGPSVSGTIDPNVTSSSMAKAAATGRALRELGVAEAVKVDAMLNPALDVSDPFLVVKQNLGLNQVHVVDSFTVPLRTASQAIGSRRRQVVIIGD